VKEGGKLQPLAFASDRVTQRRRLYPWLRGADSFPTLL